MKLPKDSYLRRLVEEAEETTTLPDGGVRVRNCGHYDFFDENGRLHNYNGPATCQVNPAPNACEGYYIHGEYLSKSDWQRLKFSREKEVAMAERHHDISQLGQAFLEALQQVLQSGMSFTVNGVEYVVQLQPSSDESEGPLPPH